MVAPLKAPAGVPLQQAGVDAAAASGPMLAPNWFLALPLPSGARWQDAADSAPPQLQRIVADDLHCTVAFLGACGESRAVAAWQALASLRAAAIPIGAAGWRALGPVQQPSAYGVTFAEGHRELCALLQHWQPLARAAAGLPPAARPPLPHVTLLRPQRREAPLLREPMRAWMMQAPIPQGVTLLQELALWTWDPDRRERRFRITARRSLG